MDTNNNNNNKQCECNKPKVVNDLLKRISNLEFDVEDKQRELESLKQINEEHQKINGELRVENDRLNNIIEEIREYVKHKIVECYDEGSTIGEFYKICDIEEKLQELKGDGDSENL